MYHFYFKLPKNDKNPGTVFLPNKKSAGLPVIISCYGWNKIHWPKRMEEGLRDLLVNKHGMAFVTMELRGQSDDTGGTAGERWKNNLADMVSWVKEKHYFNGNIVGLFAFGAPAAAALRLADEESGTAFSIVTLTHEEEYCLSTKIPVLFLQGTADKVSLHAEKLNEEDIIKQHNAETKSSGILFKGSDYYLYNVIGQAADEIVNWLMEIGIIIKSK
jgi:alpha/beta superfamily hydrolase